MEPDGRRAKLAELSFDRVVTDERTSGLQKYQRIVVGEGSLWSLAKYEVLVSALGPIPGAFGMVLRGLFYRALFRSMGKNTVIGSNVTIRQPSRIRLGAKTVVDDLAVLSARGSSTAGITIGDGVLIGRGAVIRVREGVIDIGESSRIGPFSIVGTSQKIEIGRHVLIAALSSIGGETRSLQNVISLIATQDVQERGGVVIEDDVLLGAQVIVNDGVRIGKGSFIGAGSVVTKDIPPYCIAYGVPARVRRRRGRSME